MSPRRGSTPKHTDWPTVSRKVTLTLPGVNFNPINNLHKKPQGTSLHRSTFFSANTTSWRSTSEANRSSKRPVEGSRTGSAPGQLPPRTTARLYVPALLRLKVFPSIHDLSHPGTKATAWLVAQHSCGPTYRRIAEPEHGFVRPASALKSLAIPVLQWATSHCRQAVFFMSI
jgi:hypothetical protein